MSKGTDSVGVDLLVLGLKVKASRTDDYLQASGLHGILFKEPTSSGAVDRVRRRADEPGTDFLQGARGETDRHVPCRGLAVSGSGSPPARTWRGDQVFNFSCYRGRGIRRQMFN